MSRALHADQAAQRSWADALGAHLDAADLWRAVEVVGRGSEVVSAEPGPRKPSGEGPGLGSTPDSR